MLHQFVKDGSRGEIDQMKNRTGKLSCYMKRHCVDEKTVYGYEEHWMMEIYHDNGDIESLRGSKLSEQKVVERNHSERAILASNEANGKCSCDTNNCNDH